MSYTNKKDEKDDFWDLEKLVPRKKTTLSPFATRPVVREHTVDTHTPESTGNSSRTDTERKLSLDSSAHRRTEDITYYPENSLIKSVTVKKIIDKYDFYDSFRKAALLYYACPGEKCDFAQFFSYVPQYSQLTKAQKDYYFYWRSEMRQGRFIKTDYSYLYLYVYEILNLPDVIPPEEGIRLLCRLWKEYRAALPRIDMYFSIWVSDYCLVHRLPCPTAELQDFIFDVIKVSDFKEYYFNNIGRTSREGVWTLLAYLSDYDWHRGLYSVLGADNGTEEQKKSREMYKTLLEGAMRVILPTVWQLCLAERSSSEPVKITRNAFPSTLLTHTVKCKLEIEYYPIADATDLRLGITAAVKYAENKLRGLFGVKSRLAVKGLPDTYRELIDCYFAELIEKSVREQRRRSRPSYESQYDAPREALSMAGADEIERLSWDTTLRLCDTVEDEPDDTVTHDPPVASVSEQAPVESYEPVCDDKADAYGLDRLEIRYISALCTGDDVDLADVPEESVVERINEAFSDNFGDVVIEHNGDCFTIIEDYREEITEWLKKF